VIRWGAEESIQFVDIELSVDDGSTWSTIIDEVPNNGTYLWLVPQRFSSACLIRISDANETAYHDVSDVPFVIARPAGDILITVAGDDACELFVNGLAVGQNATGDSARTFSAQAIFGLNLIAVKGTNAESSAGVIAQVVAGDSVVLSTGGSWLQNTTEEPGWQNSNFDDSFWWPARDYGLYGVAPWGKNIAGFPDTSSAHWIWGDTQEEVQVFFRGEFYFEEGMRMDSLAPQVSNFRIVGTTHEAVTLFWETDEAATSQIEFGLTDTLGEFSIVDTSRVTRHTFRLSGLFSATSYYVRAIATDGSGNRGLGGISVVNTFGGLAGDTWDNYPGNPFVIDVDRPVYRSSLFVEDLNGDDLLDYCYRSLDAVYAYDHFGGLLWWHPLVKAGEVFQEYEDGTRHSAGDIDGDGQVEVILLDGINTVFVYDGLTGAPERTIVLPLIGQNNIWYHISIVNLRGVGDRDFVAQSRDISGINRHLYLNKNLIAWDLEGNRELWRVIHDNNEQNGIYEGFWGSAHSSFHAADVDFDGRDEIVGANMIESDGTIVDLGYPTDWVESAGEFIDHIDAVSIGDFRPELPGLEWVITEEDHVDNTDQWHTSMLSVNGLLWRVETDLFADGPDREPQNIAVGNFDPTRQYAEIWVRSRFSTPESVQHPWVIDAFGEQFADYAMDEVLPAGFSTHPYGNREGIEEISVIDWEGGPRKFIAAAARHVDGDIGVFDAVTGGAVWTTGHDFDAVRASLIYVADVAGDNREEIIIYDKVRRQLQVFWNDGISLDPIKPRKWQDPLYRRQNQNWNYYSPSSYINDEPADRTPPDIRNLQLETGPGRSVQIMWQTDELALSEVRFGLSTLSDIRVDSAFKTEHTIRLTSLATDSIYTFQANSQDRSLNWSVGDTLKFIVGNEEIALPAVTAFSPIATERNTEIRIIGARLATTAAVYFGGSVEASFVVESDSAVTATVPDRAQTGPLIIVTKGGLVRTASIEILPDPELHLISPNGGENFLWDSQQEIAWQTTGRIDTIAIEYSLDGGLNWVTIVTTLLNTGEYPWRAPSTSSEDALIRITGRGVSDTSDATFSIAPFTLEILSPNGGEQVLARGSHTIRWQTVGSIPTVDLEYSPDGGISWLSIAAGIGNTGSYQWVVPAQTAPDVLIRISGRGVDDLSNAPFSIVPGSLTIVSPGGGEKWLALSEQEIRWQTIGVIDSVALSFSLDAGLTWMAIVAGIANTGSYIWRIPAAWSDRAKIRISGSGGVTSESPGPFMILPGTLTITTPNGGEEWRATDSYQLNWAATGAVDSVRLDYSLDNGLIWNIITERLPNAGKFDWTLPDTSSDSCLVRVSALRAPTVEDRSDRTFEIYPSIPVVTDSGEGTTPEQFRLHPNYPNPFNPVTTIVYELPEEADVNVTIFDMLGRQIRILFEGRKKAGGHDVRWHGDDESGRPVSSGLYFYRVTAGSHVAVRKMLLIR
jgi:hypothetical protein